jgi:hypothetical protein
VPALQIGGNGSQRGLDVGFRTTIDLAAPTIEVSVTLVTFSAGARVVAFDANNRAVAKGAMSGSQRAEETIVLTGANIARIVIDAPQDETVLLELCIATDPQRLGPASRVPPGPVRAVRPVATPLTVSPQAAAATTIETCMRALQLPERILPGGTGEIDLTDELAAAAARLPDERWVELRGGPLATARLYLAVARRTFAVNAVTVEQLDAAGNVIAADPLSALNPVTVSGSFTGLPATWTDTSGPWWPEIEAVATFLADPSFNRLLRVWVTVKPEPEAQRLRIRVSGPPDPTEHPAVILAAAELCSLADAERAVLDQQSRDGQLATVAGFLGGSAAVPLLAPDESYTLHVDYRAFTKDTRPDGTIVDKTIDDSEAFRFQTDNLPPIRLDPYVLAVSPRDEEQFVFAGDTVRIVFNDLQIVQLYARYSRQLRVVLRSADGIMIPPSIVQNLDEAPATFTSPLLDSLDAIAENGRWPCLGPYTVEGHASFTVPEPLRPSMAYTLDIETVPPMPAPSDGRPVVPLFRRAFTTGRFLGLADLVEEMKQRALEHRPLTAAPTGLPTGPGVHTVADLAIETALIGAGLDALPAPDRGGRIVLWRPTTAGSYVPHAVVLDAAEPLWRLRDEPKQEVVDPSTDPSFQRVVPGQNPSLLLEAVGASRVRSFVHSPSGTRTIVLLDDATWPAGGATVQIDAVRPASALYGTVEERVRVTTIPLDDHAPWEDGDE